MQKKVIQEDESLSARPRGGPSDINDIKVSGATIASLALGFYSARLPRH